MLDRLFAGDTAFGTVLARFTKADRTALAVVFGLVSIPWTYAFETAEVPLWPAFVASATYFAAGGGRAGLGRALASNLVGIGYAAATLWLVAVLGGDALVLSAVVGAFMFLATIHASIPFLSFTPGGFLGYASLFGVHAADRTVLLDGLWGVTVATALAMVIGASIGFGADEASERVR